MEKVFRRKDVILGLAVLIISGVLTALRQMSADTWVGLASIVLTYVSGVTLTSNRKKSNGNKD